MVRDILRLDLAVNSVTKPLNRVEKIPNLVVVKNANPRVSLFMSRPDSRPDPIGGSKPVSGT